MQPKLLIADKNKKIVDVPFLTAVGAKAGAFFSLEKTDLIKLPYGSELFILPDRHPVGFDEKAKAFIALNNNPFSNKEKCFAVAAFISPGFTTTYSAAYTENVQAKMLPLFSYAPVCFYRGDFYVPAIRVDAERRQDLRLMPIAKIKRNVIKFKKLFSKNRLFKHLIRCALVYNCPAGKNFFLQRFECPLPASPTCNSRCAGCISQQPGRECSVTQPRITFTPTPEEIAEIALFHIRGVKKPVVSFGQGCEGEPLMAWNILLKSIRLIRQKTKKGTINLNTNASKPEVVKALFMAGLDSMRVSINSVRKKYYNAYYRPVRYNFEDVVRSIKYARKLKGFVSLNYLTMPGFTDNEKEVKALLRFLKDNDINMIQWRNLNYDPAAYLRLMRGHDNKNMAGIKELMRIVKKRFPKIKFGYFNPHTNY